MTGITMNDLLTMTPEQLAKAASKKMMYTDKSGRPHVVLEFPDDDIPQDVLDDLDAMIDEE